MYSTINNSKSLLKFGKGNAKLSKLVHTFSLPAGWSCIGADKCLAKSDPKTGKLKDGQNTKFRCFAASQEALYPSVRKARWHNFNLLRQAKTTNKMRDLILKSLPKNAKIIRIGVSGDYFNQQYFDSWLEVAKLRPKILFYGYTKSISFWMARTNEIPKNFILTASEGGKQDDIIRKYKLRYAKVVFSPEEAKTLKLPIDHDDSHAMKPKGNFSLVLHGVQAKNSPAAKALSILKQRGIGGYSKKISLPVL